MTPPKRGKFPKNIPYHDVFMGTLPSSRRGKCVTLFGGRNMEGLCDGVRRNSLPWIGTPRCLEGEDHRRPLSKHYGSSSSPYDSESLSREVSNVSRRHCPCSDVSLCSNVII
ncbi:hypothetical protein TNCV_974191 [Trichonephila clavipes]|nr:hypothetical protein TNCV_974191 [Trichonephila clavipes]